MSKKQKCCQCKEKDAFFLGLCAKCAVEIDRKNGRPYIACTKEEFKRIFNDE